MNAVTLRKGRNTAGSGHGGSTMMSMYSDLLAASVSALEDIGDASAGEHLARLIDARRRLSAVAPTIGPATPAAALAAHIDYDVALISFCAARGIVTHPERFGTPGTERRRLEAELARGGVDLDALESASSLTSPAGDRSGESAR